MNNKAHLRPKDFDSNGDIIPMSWKEEKGDLISRNALIQHAYSAVVDGVEKDIIDLSDVDNAPTELFPLTVEIKDNVTDEDIETLKRLMADYRPQIVNIEPERPQGEFTDLEQKVIADAINYLLGAELLEENGYTEEVINALKSVLVKLGAEEDHL